MLKPLETEEVIFRELLVLEERKQFLKKLPESHVNYAASQAGLWAKEEGYLREEGLLFPADEESEEYKDAFAQALREMEYKQALYANI